MNYLGHDVHKRTISYCVGHPDGSVLQEGCISASREALDTLIAQLPGPCLAGTEATLFAAWVYDCLRSMSIQVKVAHTAMLKAIFAGKRKNDEIDARKLADLLRCNYFPECHIASRQIRDRRRVLRDRNVLVRQSTQTKNKMAAMLMETGIPYNKQQLYWSKKYVENFVEAKASMMPEGLPGLLRLGRNVIDVLRSMDRQLVRMLETDAALTDRVARLMTVPGVGVILALSWALEMGDVSRFSCAKGAISYCGLCGAEDFCGQITKNADIETAEQALANDSHRSRESRSSMASGVCDTTSKNRRAIATAPHWLLPESSSRIFWPSIGEI